MIEEITTLEVATYINSLFYNLIGIQKKEEVATLEDNETLNQLGLHILWCYVLSLITQICLSF